MVTVFSSTGCVRCKIVKAFLSDQHIDFVEHDIKTEEGNAEFKAFYRSNRSKVHRDEQGIFFPIVVDGDRILQDAGSSLAWFVQGEKLSSIIQPNNLGHGWTGGLRVADYGPELSEAFLRVIRLMKNGGLQTEITTAGMNPSLLNILLAERLADRLLFELRPSDICGTAIDQKQRSESLSVLAQYAGSIEATLDIDLAWFTGEDGKAPDAPTLGAFTENVRSDLSSGTLPCRIRDSVDESKPLFVYRTAVRRWFPRADIVKK